MRFRNRSHAGQLLAAALKPQVQGPAIVYALPRGGVPVAAEIASALDLPLDLVIARKVGHPLQPEYAICAVTETGEPVCNERERERTDSQWLKARIEEERHEARRRREAYSPGHGRKSARGRCAIIVDDGIATGLTMQAAVREIRSDSPSMLVVAVPVSPPETAEYFRTFVDKFVAVVIPEYFHGAVRAYYEDFQQTSDDAVIKLLARFRQPETGARHTVN
jgi:putative phosphoribosyl transferase